MKSHYSEDGITAICHSRSTSLVSTARETTCKRCGLLMRARSYRGIVLGVAGVTLLFIFPILSLAQQPTRLAIRLEDAQVKMLPAQSVLHLNKPSRYDWSFIRDWKLYTGVGFSFAATAYDISTSHGYESTRFYRSSDGQLDRGKYLGVTALTNVALLPLDLQRDHRWRWVSFGLRAGLAGWRMKSALRNGGR